MKNNKLIVIAGPTASGKTEIALDLAKRFDGEIINADSRQIYKEMDILTNKIDERDITKKIKEKETVYLYKNIPIYLLDIISPDQKFSVAEYKKLATEKIKDIQKRNKLPIIAGGTGLYIDAVVNNFQIPVSDDNYEIRERLEKEDSQKIFEELKKVDPTSAEQIGSSNKRKLIRALEVYLISGKTFSSQKRKDKPEFSAIKIAIATDRKELYEKIDTRVEKMIELGAIEETETLLKKYSKSLPAMSGIGYRELTDFLESKETLEEAKQKIKYRTHQYARRQITWFKKDKDIQWENDFNIIEEKILKFIK